MARTYRNKKYKEKDNENKMQRKLSNKRQRKQSKTKNIIARYEKEKLIDEDNSESNQKEN